jgi:hypothetical protein
MCISYTLVAISVDRYLAISTSLRHAQMTHAKAITVIAIVSTSVVPEIRYSLSVFGIRFVF